VAAAGEYDFVLSVLTLHHAPDLHAALSRIRLLLAPGGRAVLMDVYPAESALRPPRRSVRWLTHRALPRRPRIRAMAALRLGVNLVRRGPSAAGEIYRLSTRRAWLDHLVSDRFFSREELERCGADYWSAGCESSRGRRSSSWPGPFRKTPNMMGISQHDADNRHDGPPGDSKTATGSHTR
jgi:SAM-dependent methyltransferase